MSLKKYSVELQSEMSKSFHANLAAQSLDINVEEKSKHHFEVEADLETPFNIGLIVGASGSGKTTLARQVFGDFKLFLDKSKAVIDQFPATWTHQDRADVLTGMGLTSVPCWLKPAGALSNGQQARAEAALQVALGGERIVIDEWTSVVDRTVAKAMSNCIQKYARRSGKQIVLIACHFDIVEWLDPDWIVDCNSQTFVDRRALRPRRQEKLRFDLREVTSDSWKRFSKYHYLSSNLPGGKIFCFGLFHGDEQIGFQCFANYMPKKEGQPMIFHSNRTVIHPDYCGLSLGGKVIDVSSQYMVDNYGYRIMAKFSSTPVYKSMMKSGLWKLRSADRIIGDKIKKGGLARNDKVRTNLKIYSFEFIGVKKNGDT